MSDSITNLLQRWKAGEPGAESRLMEEVYPVIRALTHRQLRGDRQLTMQPTELAHEAYFRLVGQRHIDWKNSGHFFAIAARMVRRVVIDYLRERAAEKRGSGIMTLSLDQQHESDLPVVEEVNDWLRIDKLLTELEAFDAQSARMVELRYFMGMTIDETAYATGLSTATLGRQWRTARAWLHTRLTEAHGP